MKYFYKRINGRRVCCHCGWHLGSPQYHEVHKKEAFQKRAEIMEKLNEFPEPIVPYVTQ